MLVRMWRERISFALLVGMQAGAATLENSMEVPQKLEIELPYDPAIALLGIYPRDSGVLFRRGTCTPMFIAALSAIAKVWKEPKCLSTDEWIKMWCIYIYIHTHHIFFIHSSADGHLGSFHTLAVVDRAAINIGVHVPFRINIFVSFG